MTDATIINFIVAAEWSVGCLLLGVFVERWRNRIRASRALEQMIRDREDFELERAAARLHADFLGGRNGHQIRECTPDAGLYIRH
jgi:hypothetical protein